MNCSDPMDAAREYDVDQMIHAAEDRSDESQIQIAELKRDLRLAHLAIKDVHHTSRVVGLKEAAERLTSIGYISAAKRIAEYARGVEGQEI